MSKDKKSKKPRRSSASYKSDLEKLFQSGAKVPDRFQDVMNKIAPEEGSPEAQRAEALEQMRELDDMLAFKKAFDVYRKTGYALPDDEYLLSRMLDHPRETVIIEVLTHLVDFHRRQSLKGLPSLKARIKTVMAVFDDPRIHELAEELSQELK